MNTNNATWKTYVEAPRSFEFEKSLRTLCHQLDLSCEANTVRGNWSIFGTVDTIFFKVYGDASKVKSVLITVRDTVNKYNKL